MRAQLTLPFVLLTLVCLILLADGRSAHSQPQDKAQKKPDSTDLFKRLAKDKDFVTIADQQPLRGKEEMELFARENFITNGQLNKDQFQKYYEQRDELRRKTATDPKKIALEEQATDEKAADNFRRYDLNSDGFWNADEISKLKNNIAVFKDEWQKWDKNRDTFIDPNEFKTYYREYTKRRNEAQNQNQNQNQTKAKPGDAKIPTITIIEEDDDERPVFYHAGDKLPPGLPKWFAEVDLNKDGQVSLFEWEKGKKDIEEFVKMDRNDDGFLTAEEMLFFQRHISGRAGPATQLTVIGNTPEDQTGKGRKKKGGG